ncbi:MAG TPA: tRNA glutamyl-Q(34) synthetase GluQRS [Candidatus Polarisedimenticolaceae bacterium]|nr:tRNA glutamyl-Q(34) synthetase GluQRS [Candidatus Polarisedimenticolaceae bacterium]
MRAPRGRYAPSPTGDLHLGNASTALLAWLSARGAGGAFVLRVEDLDAPRARPGALERCLDDLVWLGLDWDEGPDRGGPFAPYVQSARRPAYEEAFERLQRTGRVYPCFCSRKDAAAAASAPQELGDEAPYAGRCRALPPEEGAARLAAGRRHAWRFRVEGEAPGFVDRVAGAVPPRALSDFVVRRSDGIPAYQLAVVVDDAAMNMTEVVRGHDLLGSTPRQLLLYAALGLAAPAFAHVPLWLGRDGARLSKRHAGITLRELRQDGWTAPGLVGLLAERLGLRAGAASCMPGDLLDGFALELLSGVPSITF